MCVGGVSVLLLLFLLRHRNGSLRRCVAWFVSNSYSPLTTSRLSRLPAPPPSPPLPAGPAFHHPLGRHP